MATSKADPLGHGPCPIRTCSGVAFFTRSAGGKRKYLCTYCTSSGYADEGGAAARLFESSATPAAAPAAANPPAPTPVPAPRRAPSNLLET